MKEIWKPIEGYEDYEISNFGRVKSLKFDKEKILKQIINNNGFCYVNLSKGLEIKQFAVHILVSQAFLKPKNKNSKIIVKHKNGIKTDNRACNLKISNARELYSKNKLNTTSKFVGVSLEKSSKKWRSDIKINGNQIFLGLYNKQTEARKAYKEALANTNEYNGNVYSFRELIRSKATI